MITQNTTLNMVIGYPLAHTYSPILHNAIYQQLNIDSVMMAFPHYDLVHLISALKTLNVGLTAVTMPFKQAIIPYLNHCSPEVTALNAANTIIQKDRKLLGYNTDVAGIEYALRTISLREKNILIIGAGGAASALGYVLQAHHAHLFWLNRSEDKALSLISLFGGQIIHQHQLHDVKIDVVINTTPLGMYPNIDASPLSNEFFQPQQTVFDMIYNPGETKLLQQAKAAGATIISGMDMFIAQGIKQISLWQERDIHTPDIALIARTALS